MNPHAFTRPFLLMAALSLAGCGAIAPPAVENGTQGWVTTLYKADDLKQTTLGCAHGMDLSKYGSDSFAGIREPHGRRSVYVLAHVPRGMQLNPGDEVEISPARCSPGVLPEVRRVLAQ